MARWVQGLAVLQKSSFRAFQETEKDIDRNQPADSATILFPAENPEKPFRIDSLRISQHSPIFLSQILKGKAVGWIGVSETETHMSQVRAGQDTDPFLRSGDGRLQGSDERSDPREFHGAAAVQNGLVEGAAQDRDDLKRVFSIPESAQKDELQFDRVFRLMDPLIFIEISPGIHFRQKAWSVST